MQPYRTCPHCGHSFVPAIMRCRYCDYDFENARYARRSMYVSFALVPVSLVLGLCALGTAAAPLLLLNAAGLAFYGVHLWTQAQPEVRR